MKFARQPRHWREVSAVAEDVAKRIGKAGGLNRRQTLCFHEFNESIERLYRRYARLDGAERDLAIEAPAKLAEGFRIELEDGFQHSATFDLSEEPHHAVYDANEAFFQSYAVLTRNLTSMIYRFKEPFRNLDGATVGDLFVFVQRDFPHLERELNEIALAYRHEQFLCQETIAWPRTWNTWGTESHHCELVFYGPSRERGQIPDDAIPLEPNPDGNDWEKWAPNVGVSLEALTRLALQVLDRLRTYFTDPEKYRRGLLGPS
jgi:hypothetical protein